MDISNLENGHQRWVNDWAGLMAVAVVVAHEVLAHRLAGPRVRGVARFGAAVMVLGVARAAGVSWAELGLARRELGSGARFGSVAGACAAMAVSAGVALPATRPLFRDERGAAGVRGGGLAAGLARITFATVPPEELIYRSALLSLRLGDGSEANAVAWSSVAFGLSHIVPTLSTMSATALNRHLARGPLRQAAFVGGNVMVTSLAGTVFAWLRLRSGSVVAPLLAHAALNDAALVASRVVQGPGHEPAAAGRHGRSRRQPAAR